MAYEHGITINENPTSVIPPIQSSSGIQVIVGTAPVNLAEDITKVVNKPVLAFSLAEAVKAIGYSDDWDNYSLSESIDINFNRLRVAPIIFINVLDPEIHKEDKIAQQVIVANNEGIIDEFGVLLDTVVVKNQLGDTTYILDVDYAIAFNKDGYPIISILEDGNIGVVTELQTDYTALNPLAVTDADIIGGYDTVTNTYTGLEVITQVYPQLGLVPGILIAPGWSHKPVVASVIDAKCKQINGNFNCMNVLDIDPTAVATYQEAPAWKSDNGYTSEHSIVCYPKAKIGDIVYWYSSVVAAVISRTDAQNDSVPYVSPSNKSIPITGMTLEDGTEVFLDQMQANFLNGSGIVTALNLNGWRTWGNNTAAYPGTTDPKDRFISIRRVFFWWGNTFILTYMQTVDDPTNFRLIESIVDSENLRANGFQARGQIAGAKIEFRQEDNPITDILNGRIQFIQKIGAFGPAEHIVNVLEFDPTILSDSLFGGE